MERIMENLARVNPNIVAEQTGVPVVHVGKVIKQLIENHNNRKRQPQEPAPPGGISLREVERKYNIPCTTLSGWHRRGWLPILRERGKGRKVYVAEEAIIKLAPAYKEGIKRGSKKISKIMRK